LPRKAASEQLAERWKPAAEFPFEAGAEVREAALETLRDRWQQENGGLNPQAMPGDTTPLAHDPNRPTQSVETQSTTRPQPAAVSAAREQEVAALLAQLEAATSVDDRSASARRLAAIGAELPPIAERLFDETHRPLPEAMFRDVLPSVSAEFALIDRFTSAAVAERRQAADALRAWTAEKPLTPLALERLATLSARETDALVWIGVLTALADDGREPSLRIGYAGLGHPSPEVRRRACEHLGTHPETQHGPVLSLSLTDPSPQVVLAAVKALGRLPTLNDSRPLEQLLSATDHELRVAAAESLCRLRRPSGVEALTRLASDPDSRVRREAAVAMGEAPDPAFLPLLIRLLDDRPEVRRAALLSLPMVTGQQQPTATVVPAAAYQPDTASVESPQIVAKRWKDWYRSQTAPQ
jgi:HEAT repeat protein